VIGTVLAGVACISSLLLLYWLLDSWRKDSVFEAWLGIGGISYGQITTSIFLKVAVSDFLTLFSARAGEDWFWVSRPAPILLVAAGLALSVSTLLACIWPMSRPDGIPTLGLERKPPHILPIFIWIYCIIWWIIQDAAKVLTYKILKKYDVFQYNDTGMLPTFGWSSFDGPHLGTDNAHGLMAGLTGDTSPGTLDGGYLSSLEYGDLNQQHVNALSVNLHSDVSVGKMPMSPDRASSVGHYQHPNYHHHHHSPASAGIASAASSSASGFINAAVAVTTQHIAGAQLLYGKVRSKTPVGLQYATTGSGTIPHSTGHFAAAAPSLFKQGKGN
jgi:hypothetical protein